MRTAILGLVMFGLLAMVQQSMQLSPTHPQYRIVQRVNQKAAGFGFLGLVVTSSTSEKTLNSSGAFVPDSEIPFITMLGRKYHIGTIGGLWAVYVNTGGGSINTAIAVQVMVDRFSIAGLVLYGTAGSVDDETLFIGDVSVPSYVAYLGNWKWQQFNSSAVGQLVIKDYNYPENGDNLLASVTYRPFKLYSVRNSSQTIFWLPVSSAYLETAQEVEGTTLQRCKKGSTTKCLPRAPAISYGKKAGSADIYLSNAAYRGFLYSEFGISTVDEDSAAFAIVALNNGINYLIVRGVSNTAGGTSAYKTYGSLGANNGLTVTVAFIEKLAATAAAGKKANDY